MYSKQPCLKMLKFLSKEGEENDLIRNEKENPETH